MLTADVVEADLPSKIKILSIMSNLKAAITGIHGWVPDYVLTNQELETMVDTNDEWITTRTGIKERRILKGEGLGSSDMGAEAAKGLLKRKAFRQKTSI